MKRSSRKIVLTLVLCLMIGLFTGCVGSTPAFAATSTKRVAVCLPGMLGDKSYCDGIKIGADKASAEFGTEVKYFEAKSPADWQPNAVAAAEGKYDLGIFLSGQQRTSVSDIFVDYPDQQFATIDFFVPGAPNVFSMEYAANEGTFLAGAAATLLTKMTEIKGINDTSTVGFIVSSKTPTINNMIFGYEQGAKYIDPNVTVLLGETGSATDALRGKEIALSQFDQGADIIMNCAQGSGMGIIEAAKDRGLYAIGVDINQDDLQPGTILCSVIKDVGYGGYYMIDAMEKGTFQGGKQVFMSLEPNGMYLSDFSVFKTAHPDYDISGLLKRINQITEDIRSGKVKVEAFPGVFDGLEAINK